uniref:Phosphomannomutase/phosphoglucomutase n=1 Tax=candidate division WOR-3 bacterium TaxID=2052148 RepID=A0A7C4XEK2_UNCW3
MVNPQIFREYDIRGIAHTDLNEENVLLLARALGTYYQNSGDNNVVVGYDARISSPKIEETMVKGLIETGCNVVRIGMVPTPVLYFSLYYFNIPNGIMITASHNPKEFNGFKVCAKSTAIYGAEIKNLYKIICAGKFVYGQGSAVRRDLISDYINYLIENIEVKRGLKVVFDTGNGTCGPIVEEILKALGCKYKILFKEPDGNFPNHLPDPVVEKYIKDLIDCVKRDKYEIGIGLDGDGDRIGVVDETGRIIWGDVLLAIFAEEVLRKKPGSKIIFEVKCSKGLIERIKELGGIPIMYRTGHSLIKAKMKEEGSPLAGEMSGHIFFADRYFGYDDAIYASLRLLEIISQGKNLAQLSAKFPRYYATPEIRIETDDEKKFEIVENLKDYFRRLYKVIDIDGVRVDFGDGWGLIRASNTQPVFVLRFEAKTPERLEEIKNLFFEQLEKARGQKLKN